MSKAVKDYENHRKDLAWQLTFEHIDWEYFTETLERTKALAAKCEELDNDVQNNV